MKWLVCPHTVATPGRLESKLCPWGSALVLGKAAGLRVGAQQSQLLLAVSNRDKVLTLSRSVVIATVQLMRGMCGR